MPLGINRQTASDLAWYLKTQKVYIRDIQVGDLIWDEECVWEVIKREWFPDHLILYDMDDNSITYSRHMFDKIQIIIDRKNKNL